MIERMNAQPVLITRTDTKHLLKLSLNLFVQLPNLFRKLLHVEFFPGNLIETTTCFFAYFIRRFKNIHQNLSTRSLIQLASNGFTFYLLPFSAVKTKSTAERMVYTSFSFTFYTLPFHCYPSLVYMPSASQNA